MSEPKSLSRRIVERCKELGFAAAGVCEAAPSDYADELRAWLAAGHHGSMEYLVRHEALRIDPTVVLPGARSIVMVADLYHTRAQRGVPDSTGDMAQPESPRGRIARYAQGKDYHDVVKARLHELADELRGDNPGAEFRAFVDTAPVLEREHAARSGLGWVGKHTLLIHPRLGSYMLLGGVLTSLKLEPPDEQRAVADHCGTCTRCIDACPTDAITPYSVDARRCISYLTIEHRGSIDPSFHAAMGDWIFGCDICQEVCPHNSPRGSDERGVLAPSSAHSAYTPARNGLDLLAVLGWTEADRRREFGGSSLRRATLSMMKRNAIIALVNAVLAGKVRRVEAVNAIEAVSHRADEPPLVQEAAALALLQLGEGHPGNLGSP